MKTLKVDNVIIGMAIISTIFMYHVNIWNSYSIWTVYTVIQYGLFLILLIRNPQLSMNAFAKWAVVFVLYAFFISVIQPHANDATTSVMNLAKNIVPLYFYITYLHKANKCDTMFMALWLSGVIVAIELMLNFNVADTLAAQYLSNTRLSLGGVENPNTTAYNLFISYGAGILLLNSKTGISKVIRTCVMIGIALILIGCVLTGSRKVLFGIIMIPTIIMIKKSKNPIKILGSLVVLAFGIYLFYYISLNNNVLYNIVGNRLESFFAKNDASGEGRTNLITNAFLIGLDSVIGVGFGNFKYYNTLGMYAHNEFLEIFSGTGIVGLILYYVPILYKAFFAIQGMIRTKNLNMISWGAVIVSILVLDFFQVTYPIYSYFVVLALLFIANDSIVEYDSEAC